MGDGQAVELVIEPRTRAVGNGEVLRVLPWSRRRMVGPFIFADLFGPEELAPGRTVDIDAHPHIGLSTLSYLFAGRMVHRDSTGAVQEIRPGEVNWMTAGAGVCHTERSHPDDVGTPRAHHGLQTWVALPGGAEDGPPSFEHADAGSIPADHVGGSAVRVAAGTGWGLASPVSGSSPLVLAEVRLDDGAAVPVAVDHHEVAVLAVDGDVRVADRPLPVAHLAVLEPGARPELRGTGRAMVLGGDPVGDRHIWWNFVHSDRERIESAKADWEAQRFPLVPGDHDPWVPLPSS